jgi:two-component sensor histidine kinase
MALQTRAQTWRKNADSLLSLYKKELSVLKKVDLLSKASLILLFQKPDTAFVLSSEAVRIAEAGTNDTAKAAAYASLSAVYVIRDENPMVLEYALKALKISEKINLPADLMASIYRKLGYVYRNQDEDSLSIDAFKKSIAYSQQTGNLHDISATSSNLGQLFSKIKQYDSSLSYHNKALQMAKAGDFIDIIVRSYINIMNVYDAKREFENAFATFYNMEPYLHSKEVTPIVKGLAYTSIADLDLRNGNKPHMLAEKYIDSMRLLMQQTEPGTENKVDYFLAKALHDFSTGRTDSAKLALEQFHYFKNIRDDEIIKGHAQDLAVKYETGKKEEQIKNLAEQNRLRQLLLIVFIIASLVFLGFLIWVWRQNKKIKKQEAKLSYLMKELHHRVKNNLQIVSSLLSLQSVKTEDEGAQKALQEGQYRIEAMSLIHRKLYQTDDVSGVNIKEFMKELSESLMMAYGYNHDRFDLQIQSDITHLNADTAIPLGLILNEVITNAFKYAYADATYPALTVTLTKQENQLELKVTDNGKGLTQEQWKQSMSFGKQLMNSLVKQLKGTMQLETGNGTSFIFVIPHNTIST